MEFTKRYINENEVAQITGRKVTTLRNDRHKHKGLPFIRLDRQIKYDLDDVLDYMDNHKVKTRALLNNYPFVDNLVLSLGGVHSHASKDSKSFYIVKSIDSSKLIEEETERTSILTQITFSILPPMKWEPMSASYQYNKNTFDFDPHKMYMIWLDKLKDDHLKKIEYLYNKGTVPYGESKNND